MNGGFISILLRVYQDLRYAFDRLPIGLRETPNERTILRHHISGENPLILDIGANLGSSVAFYRRLFPSARVIAFEPDRETFRASQAETRRCPRRHTVELWRERYARTVDVTTQYAQLHKQLFRGR